MLNTRVSELDEYKNEFEVDVFFARDSSVLDDRSKKDFDNLEDIAKSLDSYMTEIAGYCSNSLSKEADQKSSVRNGRQSSHSISGSEGHPDAEDSCAGRLWSRSSGGQQQGPL